jgi:hypothetical protein
MWLARDAIAVAVHVTAIARLSAVDRRRARFARIVAAAPMIAGLRWATSRIGYVAQHLEGVRRVLTTSGRGSNSHGTANKSGCTEILRDLRSNTHTRKVSESI